MARRQFYGFLAAAFFAVEWWPNATNRIEYEELVEKLDGAENNCDLIVTLESKADPTVWMQVVEGMLNLHYPFQNDDAKKALFNSRVELGDLKVIDCLAGKYVTLNLDSTPETIAKLPECIKLYASNVLGTRLSADDWQISTMFQNG